MATIRKKLKRLENADVRYISLVDRSATRMPFRVLKRDKESVMGIDLTGVFKADPTQRPRVRGLVVFAQKNEAVSAQIAEAITAHGFTTEVVQKADNGETVVYAQGVQSPDTSVVRLSDQMLVTVSGLKQPEGWMGERLEENGFYPDLAMATDFLHTELAEIATKSDTPQTDMEAALTSYAQYLNQMAILPKACYKLDAAIVELVEKCSCEETGDEKDAVVKESPEEEAERKKKETDAGTVAKSDTSGILAALKGIETTVTGLAAKLETVATAQAEQKAVLDGVVQKSDSLAATLKATVTANPVREDRPSGPQMRVQKGDEDPRTGTFDTAFLPRSARGRR